MEDGSKTVVEGTWIAEDTIGPRSHNSSSAETGLNGGIIATDVVTTADSATVGPAA